jgi:hypothetical protein
LGLGDGTFRSGPAFPIAVNPMAIVIADFNEDRIADVASCTLDGFLSVILGPGKDQPGPRIDVPVVHGSLALCAGDMNQDGHADIAIVTYDGIVSRLLGDGNGSFEARPDIHLDVSARTITIADYDGDGHADLMASTFYGIAVLRGRSDGSYAPTGWIDNFAMSDVAIADMNNDGILDIVSAATRGWVFVYTGRGDGTFPTKTTFFVGASTDRMAIADFNGDEYLDIAVPAANHYAILTSNGAGGFTRQDYGMYGAWNLIPADFDADGRVDLASAGNLSVIMRNLPSRVTATPSIPSHASIWDLAIHPNPSVSRSTIVFRLHEPGQALVEIFDVAGRHVATLTDHRTQAGMHEVVWNGRTTSGRQSDPGIYLVRLRTATSTMSSRIVRLPR